MRAALDALALAGVYRRLLGLRGFALLGRRALRGAPRAARLAAGRAPPPARGASLPGAAMLGFRDAAPALLAERFAAHRDALAEAAQRICRHELDVPGTGPLAWGDPIDWHADVRVGYRWPVRFHLDYGPGLFPEGADVKVPWEVSRLHHLVMLGQAWCASGDERYAREFFAQVEDWDRANPWLHGIHWTNAMEASIRAVNVLVACALLDGAEGWTASRRAAIAALLRRHGLFVERNLEIGVRGGAVIAGNHFLANLCGLACLGLAMPDLPEARRWRRAGLRGLAGEASRQVLPDGFFFESSTGYHRFATELLLVTALLARGAGEPAGDVEPVLQRMLDAFAAILRPDGTIPLVGDNDDGRILSLRGGGAPDPRGLLGVGAALFGRADWKAVTGSAPPEVLWLLGTAGLERYDGLEGSAEPARSVALPEGGMHVIRGRAGRDYAVIRTGHPHPDAPAGHAHNDALSIELWCGGRPVLVDPGTLAYTPDPAMRDRLRSTAAHSTVMVDEREINDIPAGEPFRLGRDARVRVSRWDASEEEIILEAEHDGYQRLVAPVRHRRGVRYESATRRWWIEDELTGAGSHRARWTWRFAPGLRHVFSEDGTRVAFPGRGIEMAWREEDGRRCTATVVEDVVAPAYGRLQRSQTLEVTVEWEGRCRMATMLSPARVAAVRASAGGYA